MNIDELQNLMVLKDAEAQFEIGLRYYSGRGVRKDIEEAIRLWKLAAKLKHIKAQYNLGVCYAMGIGVEIDIINAKKLFTTVVNSGDKYFVIEANDWIRKMSIK